MTSFRELAPDPRLGPWVRCYWRLRDEAPQAGVEPVLPDGCCELVFHLGDVCRQRAADGSVRPQPRTLLVGEIQRAVTLECGTLLDCVGVRFRAGCLRPFFDASPRELIDGVHDLAELWPSSPAWLDRLAEAGDDDASLARTLDALLLSRLRPAALDARADGLLARLRATGGRMSVEALAHDAGLSRRHLERVLTPAIGVPPKRLARILRFHGAFTRLLRGDVDAALDGYFDQSHLLRDFREFAGAPPTALLASRLELNRELSGS